MHVLCVIHVRTRLSTWFRCWCISLGYEKPLEEVDLWRLDPSDETKQISKSFEENWKNDRYILTDIVYLSSGQPFLLFLFPIMPCICNSDHGSLYLIHPISVARTPPPSFPPRLFLSVFLLCVLSGLSP